MTWQDRKAHHFAQTSGGRLPQPTTTGAKSGVAALDVRPPASRAPDGSPLSAGLLESINATLNAIPDKTLAAVIQVPVSKDGQKVLKGQVFLNAGNGLSFAGWLEHDLQVKSHLGWGAVVRKSW